MVILFAIAVGLGSSEPSAHAVLPEPPLDEMSNHELIEGFEEASVSSPDRAIRITSHLRERRREIPQSDLVSAITDTNWSQATRELMVDLLSGPIEEARVTDEVRKLLRDRGLDPGIKARIVVSYDFDSEDAGLLTSLATGPEDEVAFHALKKLGSANPSTARRLALAALAKPDQCSDSKLSASYKVLIRSGAIRTDRSARSTLLRHLASVIGDTKTSPQLQDSAAFALSDMRSLDALRTLLESKTTDRILRVGAVDQNAMLIKTALEQDPDEATIELAVTAMEVYPVKEIAEPLEAARGNVNSVALRERLEAALATIARDGVQLTTNWTED
jgi:hypothetical protein